MAVMGWPPGATPSRSPTSYLFLLHKGLGDTVWLLLIPQKLEKPQSKRL